MSLERSFLRYRNRLEKVFGKRNGRGNGNGNGNGKRKIAVRQNKVFFEPLEPRLLLSSDLTHTAAAGVALDVTLRQQKVDDVDTLQIIDNNDQSILQSQALSETSRVVINGGDLDDKLTVDFSSPILVPIIFTDPSANDNDTLKVVGQDSTWNVNGANSGNVGEVSFSGIENLTGAPENKDTFVFEAAGSIRGVVDGGPGGLDTIVLAGGHFQNVEYTVAGPDSGMIAREGDRLTFTGVEPIVDAIDGSKSVSVSDANAQIRLATESGATADDLRYVVSLNPGEDMIYTSTDVTDLHLTASGADDRIDVEDFGSFVHIRIDASGADDQIVLSENLLDDLPIDQTSNHGFLTLAGTGANDALLLRSFTTEQLTLMDDKLRVTNVINETGTVDLSGISRAYVYGVRVSNVNVDSFTGQVFVTDIPEWTEEGPSPYPEGLEGSALVSSSQNIGAINAIAIDPRDRFTIFIGTPNGGIWRNTGSKEVFFDTSESTLTADDKTTLNAFSEFLEAHPTYTVEIGGHTDSSGNPGDNLDLSRARAQSVRDYLVNIRHVEANRLRVVGYGADRPVADNLGGDQPLNRRVELLVDNWEPLTDDMPSLSISSIAISPLSSQVIYAGIGPTSSWAFTSGFLTGLLFSSDRGDHWRVLGTDQLKGLDITKVLPTTLTTATGAQVVFVSVSDVARDANGKLVGAGALFRLEVAADGTLEAIRKISGDGASGLPSGHYSDLALDPGNNGARPARVYAASVESGIFEFTDGTDGLWHSANNGFQMGSDTNHDGTDDLLQKVNRIKFALHEPTGTLYAAVLGPVDGNGMFNLAATNKVGLIGLFNSEDFGANWSSMILPTSTDNGTLFGLNAKGQGMLHFSIAVDPTDPHVIYVGGDAQGATTNNAAGITDAGAGRLFAFDGLHQTWTEIVGTNARDPVFPTWPHADSRGMVFQGNYTLLEIDDGGLYRLQNPFGDADQGIRRWASLNRDLGIGQVLRLAYDPVNNDILVGTQDNGAAFQGAGASDFLDNDNDGATDEPDESRSWSGTGGDGNTQAAVPVDITGDKVPDRVLRYALLNNFSFLQVYEYNTSDVQVDANGNPSRTFRNIALRTGPGAAPLSGLLDQRDKNLAASSEFHIIPMVVNANDPTRMLIGYWGIYESINPNINPAAGQTRVLPLDEIQQIDPAVGTPAANPVTALVYGGKIGNTPFDDLVIAARGNTILFRQAAGQVFSKPITVTGGGTTAGTIRDIVVDPSNWKVVYVADATDVYRTDDVTKQNPQWVKITGNLKAVGQQDLGALEYVENGAHDLLLVGGIGGVSRLFDPAAAPGAEQWVRVGAGLPNAPVFDLKYVDGNFPGQISGGDKLIAATVGRGVWSIDVDTGILNIDHHSYLQIFGASSSDQFKLVRETANPNAFDVFDLTQSATIPVLSARGSRFDQIQIMTRGGNDTVTVDYGNGAVAAPGGIFYDGGAGSNRLVITGGPFTSHKSGTGTDGKQFDEVIDLNHRRQLVRVDNVVIDTTAVPSPLDNAFATVKGALESLVDVLSAAGGLAKNLPLFGSSLGRALNGIEVEEPSGLSTPGGSTEPEPESADQASTATVDLLRRFIETGTGAFSIDDIKGFSSLTELVAALKGLDESGTGTVTPTGDLISGFEITLTGIKKTLSGRADVALDLLGGAVDIQGLVDVSADVTLNLVFGVDNTHGFYIKSNPTHDIVIDNIHVQAADEDAVRAVGKFGFLGVEMSAATLTMDPDVHFDIDIQKSGGDYIEVPELLDSPGSYITVNLVGHPGDAQKDATLTGTFAVSALLPGSDSPFSLFDAQAKFEWEDIGALDLNGAGNLTISPASTAGQSLVKFLKVDAKDVLKQVSDLANELSTALNIKVPLLSSALSDATQVLNFIDDKIVDPLTQPGNVASFPTVQSLIVQLANSLGIDPSTLGLSFDTNPVTNSEELTFHLMLNESLLNKTIHLGSGLNLAQGLADLEFSTDGSIDANVSLDLIVGIDVGAAANNPADADKWFFIKNPTATATLGLAANSVNASARFGFLSISVFDGSITANSAISISLKDPGTDAADGRIDIAELLYGLTHLDQLVSANITGSAEMQLPIQAPFLGINGGTPTADNTLIVELPDFTNFKSAIVQLPAALQDVGNFANIDAASFVSLMGQAAGWLDQFRHSDTFAKFDVPLVGPALDKVLALNAAFRNAILIDEGPEDQIDGSDKLATDINTALPTAGLDSKLHAEISGGKVQLIANDFSNTPFTVTASSGNELGFDTMQTSSGSPLSITATNAGPSNGQLSGDVSFSVSFNGGTPVAVTVHKSDTTDNTALGNDHWKLVNANNGATFSTVDEMAVRVAQILGIANALNYNTSDKTLAFTLNLSPTFGQIDLPVNFNLDLAPLLQLQSNSLIRLSADGSLNLTVGVYLADAPSSTKLDTSKPLSEINGGVQNKTDLVITGTSAVRTVYGQLSADASFALSVNGESTAHTITLHQSDTLNNTTAADLAADITAALTAASITNVTATADGNRIILAGNNSVTAIHLTAGGANTAVTEIGFAAAQDAVNDNGTYKIKATKDLPTLYGRLTGDATFNVSLNGGSPVAVTVPKANTDTNRFPFDIVNDVQAAIDGISALNGKIKVAFSNSRLTLTAAGATSFSLTPTSGPAATELGLGTINTTNTGNSNEFTINTRDGSSFGINLDGLTTLGDLLSAIGTQTSGKVTATLNDRQTGINLTDSSTGTSMFQVQTANNSNAVATLGILRADAQQGETPDGVIEGGEIAGLTPLDRFFLQDVNASVGLHLRSPEATDVDGDGDLNDGLQASAHVGFLGINLEGDAAIDATLSMGLKNPDTNDPHARISLTQLFNGLSDISTIVESPSLTSGGSITLGITVTPALPGLTITKDPIVLQVNSLGDPFAGTGPNITVQVPDDLVAFNNPDFSFQSILQGLKALADFLGGFESFGFLSQPIPLVNVSVKDLINLADKFATALDQAGNNPAGTVQVLQDKLKEAFGIPKASNLLTLALFTDTKGTSDPADDQYFLRITIDLNDAFSKSLNVNMDLGSGLTLGGSAGLNASGDLDVKLDFGIDLHNPTNVDIFGGTGLTADLTASGNALNFKAALGPAGIFIKDGTATLDAAVIGGIDGLTGDQHISLSDAFTNGIQLNVVATSDPNKPAAIHATLPVYFPTESKFAGDITFDWTDLTDPGTLNLVVPDNLLSIDPSQFSLLDQLSLGVDGIDLFLGGLQDALDGSIGGVKLPLVGDKLSGAAQVIGDFRTDFVDPFRQAIDDFANPTADFAQGGTDPVSKILYHLLGPKSQGGLGVLEDYNNDGSVGIDDIVYDANINDPNAKLENSFLNWHFKLGGTIVNANPGIGFDIGIPGLGLETQGNLNLQIGWSLNFGFGLDYTNGFFIDITPNDELKLDVDVSIPGGGITGTLGFLQVTADDNPANPTHLGATFGIDILNSNNSNDDKLSFSELGDLGISAGIAAEAVVDLDARLALSSELVPDAAKNFPSIVAEFVLNWGLGNRALDSLVPLGALKGSFLEDGLQFVGFKNVGLDLGSYFSNFIEPIAKKIQEYTAPVKPFLDFLTTPIPVISDLAGPTTLLDIAASSGAIDPEFVQAIDFIDKVVDIANELVIPNSGNVILKFGSGDFPIFDNRGGSGSLMLDLTDPSSIANALDSGKIRLPSWADLGGLQGALDAVAPVLQDAIKGIADAAGATPKTKLSIPIIEDPAAVFGMLLGKPAVLIDLDLAPLTFNADFSAFFPLLGPLGVSINAEFSGNIKFDFGYDTTGIQEFASGGFKDPLLLFDGFFINDLATSGPDKGKDVPEVTLDAGLWAAAELNLAVARGGVGGGLSAHITLDMHDPNKDGRVRIDELVTEILNEFKYGDPVLSPLAIFDTAGSLTARLFAFLKVDLFLFSIDQQWDITPPTELLKFNDIFVRVPTLATELGGGALQLNMGKNAAQRLEGDITDGDEKFYVKQGSDASHVLVWAPDLGVSEAKAQEYLCTGTLIGLAGKGNDVIDASGVTANIDFDLEGDVGDDVLKAGSGTGHAKILGGAGDDQLWGGGGDDIIFGEAGKDEIHGGGGSDLLFGDGDAKNSIQDNIITVSIKASDGDDTIYGDDGNDLIIGAGGVDTIHGGAGNDTLIGDGGKVTIDNNRNVTAVEQTDKGKGGNDFLYGDTGNDLIYGGPGNDTIDGGADADRIYGESGFDSIQGGDENPNDANVANRGDTIYGGTEDDTINAGAGNDTVYGEAGNDIINGGNDDDWLYGGEGVDIMHGIAGNDHLFGNGGSDQLYGDAGDDYLEGGGGDDIVYGGDGTPLGNDGRDTLVGGYGSDTLDGQDDGDTYLISSRGGDVDQLTTAYDSGTSGTDNMIVTGTAGNDTFLLRAMADYYYGHYYPSLTKLDDAITKVFDDSTINDPLGFGVAPLTLSASSTTLSKLVPTNGQLPYDVNFSVSDGTYQGVGILPASDTSAFSSVSQLVTALQSAVDDALTQMHKAGSSSTATITVGQSGGKVTLTASGSGLSIQANHNLSALEKAVTDTYTFNQMFDVPDGMLKALEDEYALTPNDLAKLQGAVASKYIDSGLAYLFSLAKTPFEKSSLSNSEKLAQIEQAITDAYYPNSVPSGMFDALKLADITKFSSIETAIASEYDYINPLRHDTGFVALLNNGGAHVERFNYRHIEGLTVNTIQGNDYVVLDDVIAATTINLGLGNDRAQVGQVFNSQRVGNFDTLITNIQPLDAFGTLAITRGWLSNGVSVATTINGGDDNDEFTVFHNTAVLNLNGGDGDDLFTIRAFALLGSIDSQRAPTDIKGDAGADTILYVVNAPVNVDGGDGFDTVRIVGTEFSDDFVVTDAGVFGAGLNVSYVNIEKLIADGAEGNDRFFVLSTGIEVVTELDGGLGSDSFFVGGTPQNGPIPVISNDFKGYSGVILHNVESTDPLYNGVTVDGVSANIVDDEESNIIVTESDGVSRVTEDAPVSAGEGYYFDSYTVRLSRAPALGTEVHIHPVPTGIPPEDQARGFKGIEFIDGSDNLISDPELVFDSSNWDQPQTVRFRAVHDDAAEGTRYTFINHTVFDGTTDPLYAVAKLLSVKVQINDDDKAGVLITPSGLNDTALEGGFTDTFQVVLTRQPLKPDGTTPTDVTVNLNTLNSQVQLSTTSLTFSPNSGDANAWNIPQTITITAIDDAVVEGFHTDFITYSVASDDVDTAVPQDFYLVNGDFDLGTFAKPLEIPIDKPTSFLFLRDKPDLTQPITVLYNAEDTDGDGLPGPGSDVQLNPFDPNDESQQADNILRYSITGNTLTFYKNGLPISISGAVHISYSYLKPGYNNAVVKDSVVDIYDNDAAGVIITQTNGSTDLIEGSSESDIYTVVLSKQPTSDVIVTVASVDTRSTIGSTGVANFAKHVYVDGLETTTLTFNSANWDTPQTVTVTAIDDNIVDGDDTQVFAPELQTTHKIRGPLILQGASGAGSLSLPAPLMLPGERNVRPFDGQVVSFDKGSGGGATEFMTVKKADLVAKLPKLNNPPADIFGLVGNTIELTEGPGTGVILDPTRPGDLFNRFWLILEVVDLNPGDDAGNVKLTLQNPTAVNPSLSNVTAPTTDTKYAITSLSVNFFADERKSIDFMMVFDNDSVANENGALTSSTGNVLAFSSDNGTDSMTVKASDLQAIASINNDLSLLVGGTLEITVGPGLARMWTISALADGSIAGTKLLTLTRVSGSGTPTDRSEFRIGGYDAQGDMIRGDTRGRIIGFGMGPNVIIGGIVQPGAITYADMEVFQMNLGKGGDTVRVDYTTNAEDHTTKRSGDFYTLTMLNTGAGNDNVSVKLLNGEDGDFALNLGSDDDIANASASTLPLTIFGWDGNDTITGGSGADTIFGDIGRVDYVNADGTIITRLGQAIPLSAVNPPVTSATAATLTDNVTNGGAPFSTDFGGLAGLVVQAISPKGFVQFRTILSNTADTITISKPWDTTPDSTYFYRVSTVPEDQTDGTFRGPRVVWSINNDQGGNDTINGGDGNDLIIGGFGNDTIDSGTGSDWVAGDDARFDFTPVSGNDGLTKLVTFTDPATPGDDILIGGVDPDLLVGGLGNDTLYGNANNDILIGDAAVIHFAADGVTPDRIETTNRGAGGADTIYGGDQDDILIGGTNADNLDGGAHQDLIFGDNVLLVLNTGSGDAINPRFRALTGTTIYGPDGSAQVAGEFGSAIQPVPGGRPAWGDWTITLDQTLDASHFGNDYIAGGGGNDEIFGQRGDDTIQGDGSIDFASSGTYTAIGAHVGAKRDSSNALLLNPSSGAPTDGDDYIEGNSGNDVIFGNLGQDDIIGGSSNLFSLKDAILRDDGSDLIFGGAGTDVARNNEGDGLHARDADMILGDNGNIYRLVGVNGTNGGAYLTFNYDNYNTLKIIPRAAQLMDYTPGGPDFNAAGATTDIGAADEVHGGQGDDFIYGMVGNDVLFGEGQDDDIIGGYGNDWTSGGTGDDGVLGDDGRILTSRNGYTEPLNGVTVAVQPSTIATGGNVQQATINVAGQLKKSVDLTPFSTDPNWNPATDEWGGLTRKNSDDIIFGGLGNDFLHGGSGDDAISGAEALPVSYAPTYDAAGNPNGLVEIDYNHPFNPGNSLAFNPIDVDGKHANRKRAGEFALYDEYDPLRKILLNGDGSASKWTGAPTGVEFFLNFDATEGPAAALDATKKTDGDDKIFGDLGNDWLVGGSGRDDMYGGFGNDLLNADDDLTTNGSLNNLPDTSASYEDRAFGGAGRDVLIANTGGDRLIDWTGEYNSYLVPFSPFGMATVSRTLQPGLMDFLYALSASDGADPTRTAAYLGPNGGDPARNGEPWGEMGLVLQKDAAWKDQHGGPSDPQPGNSNGARDVLRSANFNTGAAQGFLPQVGTFSIVNNRYQVGPSTPYGDAISLFNEADTVIPSYFEMQATINAVKPTGGVWANAYLIFDWQSNTDFKFAGINVSNNKLEIGHHTASGWVTDTWTNYQLKPGNDYVVMLKVNGSAVTLTLGTTSISFTFAQRIDSLGVKHGISDGMVGIGAKGGTKAQIDDVVVQAPPGAITLDKTVDFGSTSPASGLFNSNTPATGTWVTTTDGRFLGTASSATAPAVNLIGYSVTPGSLVDISTTLKTSGQGGVVFDYQGPDYYKFVILSADSKQLIIGHRTPAGTVIDRTYATTVSTGVDYKLGVTLRGGLVNASLNGAVVASFVFNETITIGGYGLISMKGATSGQTSFDVIRLRTDDAAYAAPAALMASSAPIDGAATSSTNPVVPASSDLDAIVIEAKHLWEQTGLDAALLTLLDSVRVELGDLDGLKLGEEFGDVVVIDIDAAGYGWFIDPTPADNKEFKANPINGELTAMASSPAFGEMDLLTVVMHELGHVLGYADLNPGTGANTLMDGTLDAGVRLLPGKGNSGNGTSKAEVSGEQSALVAMEARFDSLFARGKVNQNSWLMTYLLNGAESGYNAFGVNNEIRIVLDPKETPKPNLRRVYGQRP